MSDKCACGVVHDKEPCKWDQINTLAQRCINNCTIKRPVVKVTKEMVTDILKEIRQEYINAEDSKNLNPRIA